MKWEFIEFNFFNKFKGILKRSPNRNSSVCTQPKGRVYVKATLLLTFSNKYEVNNVNSSATLSGDHWFKDLMISLLS